MLVVLKIGFQKYLLPDDKGVQTVLRCLSKAQVIEEDHRYCKGGIATKGMCEVECEILPPTWGYVKGKRKDAEVLIPEIIREDRLRLNGRRALPGPAPKALPATMDLLLEG